MLNSSIQRLRYTSAEASVFRNPMSMIWPLSLWICALNNEITRQTQKGMPVKTTIRGISHPPRPQSCDDQSM